MRHSRPWQTTLWVFACLSVLLILAPASTSCASLGSGAEDTAAPLETVGPQTTAAVQGSVGRISAENILFLDDFQDGDMEGWQVGGAWVVQQEGDIYVFATSGEGYAFVPKGVGWDGDYAFKTLYALDEGTLGFSFDATQEGRYYVSVGTELISLVKEDAANNRTVLTQAQAPAAGDRHYLTIAKQNGIIQVYVDKTLWLAHQDAAPLNAGTIMVGALEGTSAWVDNVLVNKIVNKLPQKAPAIAAVEPAEVQEVPPPEEEDSLAELPESDEDLPDLPPENDPAVLPPPVVSFTGRPEAGGEPATSLSLPPFTNVVLEWSVENSQAVFIDGAARGPVEDMVVSNRETTRYELEVIGLDGASTLYYVDVTVVELVHGPDLVVSATVTAREGTDVLVHMSVQNLGDQDSTAKLQWYSHEQSGVVDKYTTFPVTAGSSSSIDWIWDYGQRGNMHWAVTVDTDPSGADIDTDNNYVSGAVEIGL